MSLSGDMNNAVQLILMISSKWIHKIHIQSVFWELGSKYVDLLRRRDFYRYLSKSHAGKGW